MKILFVENRYATWVYEAVARNLAQAGHEIHWLVQNPMFSPKWGVVHALPFPSRSRDVGDRIGHEWLSRTDRGVLHFGGTGWHYDHYDRCIDQVLCEVWPDAVFGEPTEFHELLTIQRCREKGLAYLCPSVTRYPPDRLAFTLYDTLDGMSGDGSALSDEQADVMLDAIRNKRLIPSYMRPAVASQPGMAALRNVADKLRITFGWWRGERFVTPSPLRKIALNKQRREQRQAWDRQAARQLPAWRCLLSQGKPWVLYAMQMQPEGNIDVWGAPWNDQPDIIRRAARALQSQGATLVVKPNPKSKYEMTARLNEILAAEPNVICLAHDVPMAEVFPTASLVLTVTGTVLLESIFAGKPVASLGAHSMTRYAGVRALSAPEEVSEVLADILVGRAVTATHEEARSLLQALHATSHSALIWDPVAQSHLGTASNVMALTRAFEMQLDILARDWLRPTRPLSNDLPAAAGVGA